jgi:hypothetical protein
MPRTYIMDPKPDYSMYNCSGFHGCECPDFGFLGCDMVGRFDVSGEHSTSIFSADPEVGGRTFLRNVSTRLQDYTTSKPRRPQFEICHLSYIQTGKHRRIHVSSILAASSPNTTICICIHGASDVACPNWIASSFCCSFCFWDGLGNGRWC